MPFPKHLGLQKHLFQYSLKMPACALGLQKHLFWYSLKIPACMIIFKILFSQKHCTLYLYSNGHVWIPIYEFEICVSVKKHASRTPTFGNGFGTQKRLQKAVQVSSILPWKQYLFYRTFCNHPEKGGKMSQKQLTSACTRIRIHSEIGKENKLTFRNHIIY